MTPNPSKKNAGSRTVAQYRRDGRRLVVLPVKPGSFDAGFTLLELIVTLGVLALALALSVPNLRGSGQRQRLQPLAAELITGLKRARAAAIAEGHPVAFVIEPATHSYRIDGVTRSVVLPAGTALTLTPPGTALRETPAGRMIFYPDGSASGGQLVLANSQGARVGLAIEWLNGTIRMSEALR